MPPSGGVHESTLPLNSPWRVVLVGAGGNGSHMAFGLARLHMAMLELGHPSGIELLIVDDDKVSTSNVGRQLFFRSDVGLYKSVVLANRISTAYGMQVRPGVTRFGIDHCRQAPDLVISCVDSAKSRREIHDVLSLDSVGLRNRYWLDMGNGVHEGQFFLGQPLSQKWKTRLDWLVTEVLRRDGNAKVKATRRDQCDQFRRFLAARLPCMTEEFPELLDPNFVEDDVPSCSLEEALAKQSLFVNQNLAAHALALLWNLFREGKTTYRGGYVNLMTGHVQPVLVKAEEPLPTFEEVYKKRRPRTSKKTAVVA